MHQKKSSTSGWSTSDTNLATALAVLGFVIRTQIIKDDPDRSGRVDTHFFISDYSEDKKYHRDALLKLWRGGDLELQDPHHPFLQTFRARRNVNYLLRALHSGTFIRLMGVANSHAAVYAEGTELPSLMDSNNRVTTLDLRLAAALGTVGIPVIKISGHGGRKEFTLPRYGHQMMLPGGGGVYDAAELIKHQEGSRDLLLEQTQPDHPVVSAYNALRVYGQIKTHLSHETALIMLRPPGTSRTALVSENASGRVMDRARSHFGIA